MQSPTESDREYRNAWFSNTGRLQDTKPADFPEHDSYWFTEDEWDRLHGKIIVVDIIRKMYPNSIANDLADVQPMGSQHGQIFAVKPYYYEVTCNSK